MGRVISTPDDGHGHGFCAPCNDALDTRGTRTEHIEFDSTHDDPLTHPRDPAQGGRQHAAERLATAWERHAEAIRDLLDRHGAVDLYERISWADPDRRFAARLVEKLYTEGDSPLRYRINRLGGRSQQDKWILQAELFNELHRWVGGEWRKIQRASNVTREVDRYYAMVRDFLKAAQRVWGTGWGHPNYMITKPVTLKAMVRVCADLARDDADPSDGRQQRWESRLAPWTEKVREFRVEGFYERFPAKGQIERVARIHRDLARLANIELRARGKSA